MTKPTLINAVERNVANPETFQIPDIKDIQNVAVTGSLKVCLEAEGKQGERFWVGVMKINHGPDGVESFDCFVDNDLLIYDKEFPYQAPITIKPENILDIMG